MPARSYRMPASLWAMAVLIAGRIPLLPTRVISIAVGTPINPSSGIVTLGFHRGDFTHLAGEIDGLVHRSTPTSATMAGAVAIAKPPMP